MEAIVGVILDAGKSAIDMTFYILAPIMVVMLALMKLLEAKGVLGVITRVLTPVVRPFGIPGLGVLAATKVLMVSFAGPISTLTILDKNGTPVRMIAATFAMVMTMSQANVLFPMAAVGLDVPVAIATSIVGGLISASVTYYLLLPKAKFEEEVVQAAPAEVKKSDQSVVQILTAGGKDGLDIVFSMIPMLIIAICVVKVLDTTGAIGVLSGVIGPLLALIGLPEASVLPLVTKFIAGGTAFMGVTLDLMQENLITAADLNRMAGFATNPLDIVGVAVMAAAGSRVKSVAKAAVYGALVGVCVRGVIHLIIF